MLTVKPDGIYKRYLFFNKKVLNRFDDDEYIVNLANNFPKFDKHCLNIMYGNPGVNYLFHTTNTNTNLQANLLKHILINYY